MSKWFTPRNLVYAGLSLLISVMLWLYVMAVSDPETKIDITGIRPTFVGADTLLAERDLQVVSGLDQTITMTIQGKRTDLAKITAQNIQVTVNLDEITSAGAYNLAYTEKLPVEGPTVVDRSTMYIRVRTDKMISRTFQLGYDLDGSSFAENYVFEEASFENPEVVVTGLTDQVNKIARAIVRPSRQDINKTVTLPLPIVLLDAEGREIRSEELTLDRTEAKLTLHISMVKEVPLAVELLEGGGALTRHVTYTVSPATIKLSGDPAVLEGINVITLGTIDLAHVINSAKESYPIVIPNDITNMSGNVSAEVSVEIKGLSVKNFDVDNITLANAVPPDGYEVVLLTNTLTIMVRGSQESLALITEHNIRVVADLDGIALASGQQVVAAKVIIDGYSDVGAVGEQKVFIEVRRPIEE